MIFVDKYYACSVSLHLVEGEGAGGGAGGGVGAGVARVADVGRVGRDGGAAGRGGDDAWEGGQESKN